MLKVSQVDAHPDYRSSLLLAVTVATTNGSACRVTVTEPGGHHVYHADAGDLRGDKAHLAGIEGWLETMPASCPLAWAHPRTLSYTAECVAYDDLGWRWLVRAYREVH